MSSQQRNRRSTFQASEEQARFLNCTQKQVLAYGGFGGGKTRTACEKGYMLNMKYPGNRGLIVRKHHSDVAKSTVSQVLLEEVIPESHVPEGPEGHNKSANVIRHFTGKTGPYGKPIMSEIHYHGLSTSGRGSDDGLPRKISGMQYGWIFVDEATEIGEGQWVNLLGRLRYNGKTIKGQKYTVPFRQIFAACNPDAPSHWLYQKFFVDEDGKKFHLKAEDNPALDDDYVETMKENYSGVYYERYVEGNWVGTSDAIYDAFDRRNYVVDIDELKKIDKGWEIADDYDAVAGRARPPDSWDVIRSIDFGYPSPMCVHWWARSPEDEQDRSVWVLFREFYQPDTMVSDVGDKLQEWSKDLNVDKTYADPAQAQDRETLKRYGISTTAAQKDVWLGIQRVKAQMEKQFDDRVPGILFYEDALLHRPAEDLDEQNKPQRTVDEIPGYEWKDGDKDIPEKKDDHGVDCMRYAIYSEEGEATTFNEDEMKEMEQLFNDGF